MPSSESDEQPPPRKRSRTSANAGEDPGSKKARGRPRVDTQDETAADRRRTQIRLAQRAYRQRKETTIASLQDKNAHLQNIIDQMNKNFQQFSSAALTSGILQLNPDLSHHLKQMTESFATLVNSSSEGSLEGDEELEQGVDAAAENQATSAVHQESAQPIQDHHMDIGWGYMTALPEAARQHHSGSTEQTPQGRRSIFLPTPTMLNAPIRDDQSSSMIRATPPVQVGHIMDQSVSWSSTDTDEHKTQEQLPFGLVDILSRQQDSAPGSQNPHAYYFNIPTPAATPPTKRLPTPTYLPSLSTKTLAPSWTYSHDETTFARRLTRAGLEAAFHSLSFAKQRPKALKHIFRLSMPFKSLDEARERFRRLLTRGTNEELESWDSPFVHLGGAGTHYPRKDAQGNIVARPNAWTVRRIGPLSSNMIRAENSLDPSRDYDLNVDLTDFEGEWFDAFDVEGYLAQEKGCRINPTSSFAEVLIDDNDEPEAHGFEDYNVTRNASRSNYSHASPPPLREFEAPSFSGGVSSSSFKSTTTTTPPTADGAAGKRNSIGNSFRSDAPFGLNMSINFNNQFAPTRFDNLTHLFNQPSGLDLAPGFNLNLPHTTSHLSPINFDTDVDIGALGLDLMAGPPRNTEEMPIVRQKKKKSAWVDVSKLVDEIIKKGVCLGRAPGFRRKDVDMAFQASILTAF